MSDEMVHVVRNGDGVAIAACNSPDTVRRWLQDEIRGKHSGSPSYNKDKSLDWYLMEGLFRIDDPVPYVFMDPPGPEDITKAAEELMEQRIREGTATAEEIIAWMRMGR